MQRSDIFNPHHVLTLGLVCISSLGGWLAFRIGAPLPWMIGALFVTAVISTNKQAVKKLGNYKFPDNVREVFIALIGVMIGTQVTPEILDQAVELPLTISALAVFIVLCHLGNMAIFRKLGGYDRATACFSATPGGLMESIMLGEAAGADLRILSAQQFLRVIVVVTALPFGLSLWLGHPVGSAAGVTATGETPGSDAIHIALVLGTACLGLWLGPKLRIPAAPLTGPMLLAAPLTLFGLIDLQLPSWMVSLAQVVIGAGLGLRFAGINSAILKKAVWLSMATVFFMLSLALIFAIGLSRVTDIQILPLVISFAPGGVAEMSLVALSLSASPALISVHHVARIIMTIVEVNLMARWMGISTEKE